MGRFGGAELSYASDLDVLSSTTATTDGRLRRRRAGGRGAAAVREGQHARRPHLPARRRPAARGQAGPAGPQPRRATAPTTSAGPRRGSARRWCGPGPWPATPDVGRAVHGARRPSSCGTRPFTDDDEREIRRMKARVERERIPPGEDPQFHLKLGPGLAVRRRVDGAAAAAAATACARRARSTRSHALVARRRARRRRRRRARRGLPVLRADPEPLVPGQGRARRLAADRSRAAGQAGAQPRHDRRRPTRRATAGSPAGPAPSSSACSTERSR